MRDRGEFDPLKDTDYLAADRVAVRGMQFDCIRYVPVAEPRLWPQLDPEHWQQSGGAGMGVKVHGATAGTARPAGFDVVTWIGTVEPTNMAENDIWEDVA